MKGIIKILVGGAVIILLVVIVNSVLNRPERNNGLGAADGGQYATVATSSTIQVGPKTSSILFRKIDSGERCLSRIVGTDVATPLFIQFESSAVASTSLAESLGYFVAASTTQSFDSAIFAVELGRSGELDRELPEQCKPRN